jgi:hypothetical protein
MCNARENGILQLQTGHNLAPDRDDGSFILRERISATPHFGNQFEGLLADPSFHLVGDDH